MQEKMQKKNTDGSTKATQQVMYLDILRIELEMATKDGLVFLSKYDGIKHMSETNSVRKQATGGVRVNKQNKAAGTPPDLVEVAFADEVPAEVRQNSATVAWLRVVATADVKCSRTPFK
jgi:hypothetical protein